MATNAIPRPIVVRLDRPRNPASDRIFFSVFAVVLWATVLYGFAKTYFLAGMIRAPLPNRLIHIHGAAFTLWMVLLVVQIGLVSTGNLAIHKKLGLAGFGLAIAMVVLGLLAATDMLRRGVGAGLDAKTFYIIPLSSISVFAVLVFFAYRARRRPTSHKRLILIATIAIMDAAVGRWPVAFLQAHPPAQDIVPFAFLLAVMIYDLVSLHRIQKSTLWASLLIVVVHLTRVPLAQTSLWQSFATHMAGKG